MCRAGSPHAPETIMILLIGYTPIENQKFKLKKRGCVYIYTIYIYIYIYIYI